MCQRGCDVQGQPLLLCRRRTAPLRKQAAHSLTVPCSNHKFTLLRMAMPSDITAAPLLISVHCAEQPSSGPSTGRDPEAGRRRHSSPVCLTEASPGLLISASITLPTSMRFLPT